MSPIRVLAIFKKLHRTRQIVFRDDEAALNACRNEINKYFKKNKYECDPEVIQKMVKLAVDVEKELRCNVIQARQKYDNVYELRITPEITRSINNVYNASVVNNIKSIADKNVATSKSNEYSLD